MQVRYIVVDDEAPGRSNLRLAVGENPDWRLVAECDSTASARLVLASQDIDVIFLDVQMPAESGLVLARDLSQWTVPPLIIFMTAFSEHAVEAFELHALDYLLKPLNDIRLTKAMERSQAMLRHRERATYGTALREYTNAIQARYLEHINVRSVGRIEQIRVSDILWVESAGNYVELHLESRTVLHRITLARLEAVLVPGEFLRVHRVALVRCDQIASLATTGDGTYRLMLHCGDLVPVSERHVSAIKNSM
jgi:two-component system LytT family response regulator